MKLLPLIVAVIGLVSSTAHASTRCTTDSFGNTRCVDTDGNVSRGTTDQFGNSRFRTQDGDVYRGRTDSFGNSTLRNQDGSHTIRGRTDPFGNTTLRDNFGNRSTCTTDMFGNSRCR